MTNYSLFQALGSWERTEKRGRARKKRGETDALILPRFFSRSRFCVFSRPPLPKAWDRPRKLGNGEYAIDS